MAKNHELVLWVVWKYRVTSGEVYNSHVFRTRAAARSFVVDHQRRWPGTYEMGITQAAWGPDNIKAKAK